MGLARALAAGTAGGTVGAALMLPLFAGATRAGVLTEAPPLRIVDEAAAAAAEATEGGGPIAAGQRVGVAVGSHLLYGAGAGACYGLLQDELELPPLAAGSVFGLALWAVGYLGWIPAAGVLPRPWRQQVGDAVTPLVAHVVYGLVLGAVERTIHGRR